MEPFWASLTAEVNALAEVLEQGDLLNDDELTEDIPGSVSSSTLHTDSTVADDPPNYEVLLCPPGTLHVMPGTLPDIDQWTC